MEKQMVVVNIAKDFTRYPSGRYKKNGKTSGEEFRERFMEAAISGGQKVVVELDGTIGYGSSFLEEAFGGLVRALNLKAGDLEERIELRTENSLLREEILQYIRDASALLT